MSAKTKKVFLVAGALLLFVLLFIAPKIAPKTDETTGGMSAASEIRPDNNANLDVYLNTAIKNLEPFQKKLAERIISEKKLDSASLFWDKLKRPDLASVYAEEKAKSLNSSAEWLKAGNRYYYSVQFTQDKTEIPLLYQSAMRCFYKSLKADSKNDDAKIMLATCYVEGTSNPMQGISMLKEVEKTDSNNVKLQLTFAFFSVKSGQMDKAIQRFQKVLEIDSNYIEAYLHLADAYEQKSDTIKTIEMLEKYSAKTNDVTAKAEIEKYIEQLKKH